MRVVDEVSRILKEIDHLAESLADISRMLDEKRNEIMALPDQIRAVLGPQGPCGKIEADLPHFQVDAGQIEDALVPPATSGGETSDCPPAEKIPVAHPGHIREEFARVWTRILGCEEMEREGSAAHETMQDYFGKHGAEIRKLSTCGYPVDLVYYQRPEAEQAELLLFPLLGKGFSIYPQDFFDAQGAIGRVRRVVRPSLVELIRAEDDLGEVIEGVTSKKVDLRDAFRIIEKGVLGE